MMKDQNGVGTLVKDYFSDLYRMKDIDGKMVDSLTASFPTLPASARQQLDKEITADELFAAMQVSVKSEILWET